MYLGSSGAVGRVFKAHETIRAWAISMGHAGGVSSIWGVMSDTYEYVPSSCLTCSHSMYICTPHVFCCVVMSAGGPHTQDCVIPGAAAAYLVSWSNTVQIALCQQHHAPPPLYQPLQHPTPTASTPLVFSSTVTPWGTHAHVPNFDCHNFG